MLSFTAALQVAPPSVERENQIRDLHVEVTLVPGSLVVLLQPASPERFVQSA